MKSFICQPDVVNVTSKMQKQDTH